jgi:hypothetical protein
MKVISLSRPEFLVLLDALNTSAIIGIDSKSLIPANPDQHRQLLERGYESLAARGLLRTAPDGAKELDQLLLAVAAVIARPAVALISVREIPDKGAQLFLHYLVGGYVAEQTFPEEGQHRLAALDSQETLFARLLAIFPVVGPSDPAGSATLTQKAFFAVKADAQAGRRSAAVATLTQSGMVDEAARALVEAMAEPVFSGTVALLRCEDQKITDARNPAIVQGREGAWSIAQAQAGEQLFQITPVNQALLRTQFQAWITELSTPA